MSEAMTKKTTQTTLIREEIKNRLRIISSEHGYPVSIDHVLDPIQAFSGKNSGIIAVIYDQPGSQKNRKGEKLLWRQSFAIDVAIPVDDDYQLKADQLRLALASKLSEPFNGLGVQSAELSELATGYPQGGRGYMAVSAELAMTYIETLDF